MDTANTQNQQVRAGCYCRISSDPDDKRAGVDRQREDTSALCEIKDWTPAGFYVDNDRSASNGRQRPEWDRLLADIKAGRVDAIAAWDQDRNWRMMHELEDLRKFFKALGRPILLATTGQGEIDLSTPTGVMVAQIKTAVSEHEVAMLKVRIRRAAKQKAERGAPNWSIAFGYDDNRQPDPVTAPLVARAYADILAGASLSEICRGWNSGGHTTVTGKPWTASVLTKFLRKPRNAGLRTYKDNLYGPTNRDAVIGTGNWPPLVDEATFWAAQDVLDAPERRPGRKAVRRHLLTGVARCGKCGATLVASYRKDGRIVYVCKACHGVSILADNLEPPVYAYLEDRLAQPDAVDLLKDERHDAQEAERLRAGAMRLRAEMDNIGIERAEGLLTGRQAKLATDRLAEKLVEVEAQQHSQERLRVFDGLPLGTPAVAAALADLSADRIRAVLDVLVTVTVRPVGKIGRAPVPDRVDIDPRN